MKNLYFRAVFILVSLVFFSCSEDDGDNEYVIPDPESPVVVDLSQVPYPKLSDYNFFEGDMKLLQPALGVLPYQPSSSLFSDYAHKKRFVWMPKDTKAVFNGDDKVLELPVGAVLIKSFYYDNVQNMSPAGGSRLLETRLMIRRADGWLFANYVWNDQQTEAFYDMEGSFTEVVFTENSITRTVNYRIPSTPQCIVCHKSKFWDGTQEIATHIPIAIKPQNLNFSYNYGTETKNQLQKWIDAGYLEGGFSFPSAQNTVPDYMDTSEPLENRARAYFDSNCAHCHDEKGHCDYRPMKFRFANTFDNRTNMGVCVNTEDIQDYPNLNKIVAPRDTDKSMLYFRSNTTDEAYRMPLHGRSIIHDEGVMLIRDWINSLDASMCN